MTHHPALISESDFVAVQALRAQHAEAKHDYQLKGLLRCASCDRAFEGHWVNQVPGYRCRHGHSSAEDPGSRPTKATYLREDRVLSKLPLLLHRLTAAEPAAAITGATASAARPVPPSPEEVIDHLRARALVLRYDPRTRTLETGSGTHHHLNPEHATRRHTTAVVKERICWEVIGGTTSARDKARRSPDAKKSCPKAARYGVIVCPKGGSIP